MAEEPTRFTNTLGQCMGGGFRSYAPAALERGCQAGFIPPGCKGSIGVRLAAAAITTIDPFQVTRIIAIMDTGSAATAVISQITVDGQPLFPTLATVSTDPGLGLISTLTPALYEAGGNPLPPMPNINNTHPALITSAVGAIVIAYRVYLGNPAADDVFLDDKDAGAVGKPPGG